MRYREIKRVLLSILILNWIVAFAKISLGLLTGAISIFSDGIHSLFDGFTNIIGYFGIKLAEKPADECHAYGHRKYEAIASQIILFFLMIAAWEIIKEIAGNFSNPAKLNLNPGWTGIAILAVCVIIDVFVARYELKKGKELKSTLLKADAMHTKSHYATTGAVIIGLLLIKYGYPPIIDSIVATFVVLFIIKMIYKILIETTSVLSDKSLFAKEETEKIINIVNSVPGVISCHKIRNRGDKEHIFLDIHIIIDPKYSLERAHKICHEAIGKIQSIMPEIKDITAHPEPPQERSCGLF
ncbi:MAG: cation transporter [Candidatus Niyogibacteria bacterium CG10_big_fil_rev_8_21_14_0_10_42_19]|uniref:Cation transporter n=1 Tax=Candidatus Niyogibacteria bacterium CG10_big_fil_rev_8_21_14_0_10_42_19 TaxID=1974725 RepID=A0A2H0TF91_9BACT|nr:MAG: cation transporter [Candidatus Niyogibacteria bacterium CG10_big_fil_rev_8_21_14_0_10_42_19]